MKVSRFILTRVSNDNYCILIKQIYLNHFPAKGFVEHLFLVQNTCAIFFRRLSRILKKIGAFSFAMLQRVASEQHYQTFCETRNLNKISMHLQRFSLNFREKNPNKSFHRYNDLHNWQKNTQIRLKGWGMNGEGWGTRVSEKGVRLIIYQMGKGDRLRNRVESLFVLLWAFGIVLANTWPWPSARCHSTDAH